MLRKYGLFYSTFKTYGNICHSNAVIGIIVWARLYELTGKGRPFCIVLTEFKTETSHLALSSQFFFSVSTASDAWNRKMTIMLPCKFQMLKAYQLASFKGHENGLIKIQKVDKVCNQKRLRRLPFSRLFAFFQI